jgi:SAM-dependent methyltransferase
MQTPPTLTDRTALARNRDRALASRNPAMFLQEDAADEIQERLIEVNRRFTQPAVVTPFADLWRARMQGARIVADDERLDLEPGAHDLVIHALCLHWANDPVGQLVQCRRALRPDGLFLGVLFGGQTLAELRACLAEAEVSVTGGLSPRVLPMAEIRDLGGLLQRAGFALPVADSATRTVTYADAGRLMADLRAMGEANALAQRVRRPTQRRIFAQAATHYAAGFSAPEGRIRATFEMIFLTGWAPDDSQPKPLRPGSAARRLADAFGTAEQPLLPATPRGS